MILSRRRLVVSALLFSVACLALIPIPLASTYAIEDAIAVSRPTGWQHIWNHTGRQHSWQHTTWQKSAAFTHTATFTHSSTTITRTFTHSSRTYTFGAPGTTTTSFVLQIQAPYYPYYYTTYYQPPQTDYCSPETPGYPYDCYPYPIQTVTAVPTYSTSVMTSGIPMVPVSGTMAHDIFLVITSLPGGQFSVTLVAQGLRHDGGYLIEGVTKATPTATVPIATNPADSEFLADAQGNGVYWHVFTSDPQATYERVLLIYLPNMQMQESQLVASANMG